MTKSLLYLVLLVVLPGAFAAPFAHEASDLKPDPAVRFGTLPNGIRYAVLHNAEPRGRASLLFGVRSGSFNETDDQRGLAHFLEHLAFNGSTHFPPGTLVEFFQRLGMSFGGDTNASTSFDRTIYQLELPNTKRETFDQAFTLFADYGGGLLLTPDSIEKERGIIQSEERARDSVQSRASVAEMEFLLPDTIMAQRIPIGTKEVVARASRERFADYYDTWYRPENFLVVAVGDFDAAAVETQLARALSSLRARGPARPAASLGIVKPTTAVVAKLHSDPDAAAVTVTIETVMPWAYEADTAKRRLKRLPIGLALAMLNRRISILAKKEGVPFSAGRAGVEEQFNLYRSASIALTCQPAQWQLALWAAEQELRRALTFGFQPEELREEVAIVRNNLEQRVAGAATRPSRGLADELMGSIIEGSVVITAADNRALLGPALDRITVEDCAAALRDIWEESPGRHLFVTGNIAGISENDIIRAFRNSQVLSLIAPEKIAGGKFAYTDFGPAGTVAERHEVKDLGATLLQFRNGVRLNIKATDFAAGRIEVSVRVGGGKLTEPKSLPGLASAAVGTVTAGGLRKHSIDELQRILAGKTASIYFGVGEDAFLLNATTNRHDLEIQLQVLCAFLTDAGYRPEALRQFQKSVEQNYATMAHQVEGPFFTSVPMLLAAGDPRFGLPDEKTMLSRTSNEVREWLAPQFARGPIEIALVGDLDPEGAIALVAGTFGALPDREAKPDYADERHVYWPAEPIKQEFTIPTELDHGIVKMMWPMTDGRDVHRARRLALLGSVFEDRLRLKLREQLGDTYRPIVGRYMSQAFTDYGFLIAQASVSPGRAKEVTDMIRAVATDLATNGVTVDELQRAKQPMLTALRTSERLNSYWLDTVLSAAQEQSKRLDWARDRYADHEAITKSELDALAKQYLPAKRASQFISLPVRQAK